LHSSVQLLGSFLANSLPIAAVYYGLAVLAERSTLPDVASDALDQGLLVLSLSENNDPGDKSLLLLEALMSQMRGDLAVTNKDGAVAGQHYKRALELVKGQGVFDDQGIKTTGELGLQSPRPQYGLVRPADPTQLDYRLAEAS